MKLKLIDTRDQGFTIPWGWGIAFRDYCRNRTVIAVIPLNLIIQIGRAIYFRLMRGFKPSRWEKRLHEARNGGYAEGVKASAESSLAAQGAIHRLRDRASVIEGRLDGKTRHLLRHAWRTRNAEGRHTAARSHEQAI